MAFPFRSQFVDWGSVNADVIQDIFRSEEAASPSAQVSAADRIAALSGALVTLTCRCFSSRPKPRSIHRSYHPAPAEPMHRE